MTNEQLALLLTDYLMAMGDVLYHLENDEPHKAKFRASQIKARLQAAIKTLGVEVFTSPLG